MAAVDATAAGQTDMPTAVVRLDNIAVVPVDYLDFAESRAAEVFSRIGVRLTWIDEETAVREHLRPPFTVVLITSGAQLLARPAVIDALGFADPGVARAHVIYDRVEALTARSRRRREPARRCDRARTRPPDAAIAPAFRSRNHAFGGRRADTSAGDLY